MGISIQHCKGSRDTMSEVKWNDRFNIGVEIVDRAHKKLFSIVGKLLSLTEDAEKQKHACQEGIKYFKSYTMKHFAEEEAYMRKIGYPDYEIHKSLHDNMQNHTLPALEQEMESQDYSAESIQHFLGICVGWLNAHIMIEDYAITGKTAHKWKHKATEDELVSLEKAVIQTFHDLFRLEAELVSDNYSGEDFASGKALCYRLNYHKQGGQNRQVVLIYEEQMVYKLISGLLGKQVNRIDKTIVEAMKLISNKFMGCMETHYAVGEGDKLEKINTLTFEQVARAFEFEKQYPPYSLLFRTEKGDYFAMCIR